MLTKWATDKHVLPRVGDKLQGNILAWAYQATAPLFDGIIV
jgi:hypothetical protein